MDTNVMITIFVSGLFILAMMFMSPTKEMFFISLFLLILTYLLSFLLVNGDSLLNYFTLQKEREEIMYVQKIILENEDKVELISDDENSNYYRVNLDGFFFDFKVYNDTYEGVIVFNLLTNVANIFDYFKIDTKDIYRNEMLKENYNVFKEKYMVEIKEEL